MFSRSAASFTSFLMFSRSAASFTFQLWATPEMCFMRVSNFLSLAVAVFTSVKNLLLNSFLVARRAAAVEAFAILREAVSFLWFSNCSACWAAMRMYIFLVAEVRSLAASRRIWAMKARSFLILAVDDFFKSLISWAATILFLLNNSLSLPRARLELEKRRSARRM